jgi:protein PsiE
LIRIQRWLIGKAGQGEHVGPVAGLPQPCGQVVPDPAGAGQARHEPDRRPFAFRVDVVRTIVIGARRQGGEQQARRVSRNCRDRGHRHMGISVFVFRVRTQGRSAAGSVTEFAEPGAVVGCRRSLNEDRAMSDKGDDSIAAQDRNRGALSAFRSIEKGLLILTALMVLAATALEIHKVIDLMEVTLADILLMFLYTEVIAMIAVFYSGQGSPFLYPIFIAITALARLIVLQGKDMEPQAVLYEAAAILLLAVAAVVMMKVRFNSSGEAQSGP